MGWGNVIFDILEPPAFQKYGICWVFQAFFCSTFFYQYFAIQPRPAQTAVIYSVYKHVCYQRNMLQNKSSHQHHHDHHHKKGNSAPWTVWRPDTSWLVPRWEKTLTLSSKRGKSSTSRPSHLALRLVLHTLLGTMYLELCGA